MKILNLYAGLGGNRLLWGEEHEIVVVEIDESIAKLYHSFFPMDRIIIGDAHEFLLNEHTNFDFIWSSPPCPTHSRVRKHCAWKTKRDGTKWLQNKPVYPDMKLYEEIIFLDGYFIGDYVVENVASFYEPLIEPQIIGRHYFWANFEIPPFSNTSSKHFGSIEDLQKRKGFDLSRYRGVDKKLLLRNCVEPELGIHILESSIRGKKIENLELVSGKRKHSHKYREEYILGYGRGYSDANAGKPFPPDFVVYSV